jgi:hypothetical protein
MTISDYIKGFKYNNYSLFFRENDLHGTYTLDKGDKSDIILSNTAIRIQNPILNDDGQLNTAYKEVMSSKNIQDLKVIENFNSTRIYPNIKYSIFNSAIVLYKDDDIIGGINLDLWRGLARSINNQELTPSLEELYAIIELFCKSGVESFKNNNLISHLVNEQWRNYEYPFDFFYNPIFEVYETRINSGLMCVNWVHAKLEITPVNGIIMPWQKDKIRLLNHDVKKIIREGFWELYHYSIEDYELPKLDNEEQLYHFVKVQCIYISDKEDAPITIYFRTWDNEHGQMMSVDNEGKIDF